MTCILIRPKSELLLSRVSHKNFRINWRRAAYFALTGKPVFVRSTAVETMTAHIASKPPEIDASYGVPEGFQKVLLRCLSKDPDCRFQSADELAYALAETIDFFK